MNWFKENPIIAAIAAVGVLGTAVGCFFAIEGSVRRGEAASAYTAEIQKIRLLEGKHPFPSEKNLQAVQASVASYKKALEEFNSSLNKMEVASEKNLTPQKFQDNLRLAADNLRKAAGNKTQLPENFFFGFDDFRTQLPPQAGTDELNREFLAIKTLIEAIVPLGITSIDTLVRHPAPAPAAEPIATPAPQKPGNASKSASPPVAKPLAFDSFTLGFTAPQKAFIAAFDKIPANPGFLVIRSMTIENTSPVAPLKAEIGKPRPGAPSLPVLPGASTKLPTIFGSELVKATIVFEIPDFPEKKAEEKNEKPSTTPTPKQ